MDENDTKIDQIDTLLAAARTRKAERRAEEELEEKRRELAILQLEEQLEGVIGGRAGEAFAIVDAGPHGPLAFRLGEAVLYKQFHTSIDRNKEKHGGDGLTTEVCQTFLLPNLVHPDKSTFLEIAAKANGVLFRCANSVELLYQGRKATEDAKR